MRGVWLRIVTLLIFVIAVAIGGGWWMMRGQGGASPAAAHTSDPQPAPEQQTDAPKPARNDELTLPGVIEPYESVPVSAKLTATIASIHVREGTVVKQGQLLCALDDTDLRREIDGARFTLLQAQALLRRDRESRDADLARKRSALTAAQTDLDSFRTQSALEVQDAEHAITRAKLEAARYESLYQANAVSGDEARLRREKAEDAESALAQKQAMREAGLSAREKALTQAKLDLSVEPISARVLAADEVAVAKAAAELAEKQKRLADARVTAPLGGTVHIIPRTRTTSMSYTGQGAEVLGPGVRVYEGDPFLEIATTERVCVRIDVDETDISRVHVGMPATISGDAFEGRELRGQISEIQTAGKKAGQGVSLFPVTVLIVSSLEGVQMGMTADVNLKLESREVEESKSRNGKAATAP